MDHVKEAFKKVKEDIDFLFHELRSLQNSMDSIKETLSALVQKNKEQTNQHIIPSQSFSATNNPTSTPTHNLPLNALKGHNYNISIGNQGVPTNHQTDQQTNQHPIISTGKFALIKENPFQEEKMTHLKNVAEVLDSLDEIKKEVRIKFKKLTSQEMAVYAAIYQLEEQGLLVDYQLLSEKVSLSEISIRDYVRKLINKGIPLTKTKQDNKKVLLGIPHELKKIASLSTIYTLRDL